MCFDALNITEAAANKWNHETFASDSDLVRSFLKCSSTRLRLFENGVFNKDRMVRQYGGKMYKERVDKCIDDNPIGQPTVDRSVQNVYKCVWKVFESI